MVYLIKFASVLSLSTRNMPDEKFWAPFKKYLYTRETLHLGEGDTSISCGMRVGNTTVIPLGKTDYHNWAQVRPPLIVEMANCKFAKNQGNWRYPVLLLGKKKGCVEIKRSLRGGFKGALVTS